MTASLFATLSTHLEMPVGPIIHVLMLIALKNCKLFWILLDDVLARERRWSLLLLVWLGPPTSSISAVWLSQMEILLPLNTLRKALVSLLDYTITPTTLWCPRTCRAFATLMVVLVRPLRHGRLNLRFLLAMLASRLVFCPCSLLFFVGVSYHSSSPSSSSQILTSASGNVAQFTSYLDATQVETFVSAVPTTGAYFGFTNTAINRISVTPTAGSGLVCIDNLAFNQLVTTAE